MHISITAPTEDLREVRSLYAELEAIGYDRAFSFEAKHNPFIALAVAGEHTTRLELGTAVAIAFARTPMTIANAAWDLQATTAGRLTLGLGSQVRSHIEQRYSMPWSRPVARMREMVTAIRSIWRSWETGETLDFRGDFYTHTRMIPAFDPGPNPFGLPPVFTGGVGPRMTELAGEVADGFLVHPVSSRESLLEQTLPALHAGARRAGRSLADVELVCVTTVVTGRDELEFARSYDAVRRQLAFYGTTPAYLPVFALHGYADLHPVLQGLARQGRWDEMADLIDDDLVETIAVVGEVHEIAPKIVARVRGISDRVSLVNNRAPDPHHLHEVVADLRELGGSGPR